MNRVLAIGAGVVALGAFVVGVVNVTSADRDLEWKSEKVGMILRNDGVDVKGVYCEFGKCWVTLTTGRVQTVDLVNYEDGSWDLAEGSRP